MMMSGWYWDLRPRLEDWNYGLVGRLDFGFIKASGLELLTPRPRSSITRVSGWLQGSQTSASELKV